MTETSLRDHLRMHIRMIRLTLEELEIASQEAGTGDDMVGACDAVEKADKMLHDAIDTCY